MPFVVCVGGDSAAIFLPHLLYASVMCTNIKNTVLYAFKNINETFFPFYNVPKSSLAFGLTFNIFHNSIEFYPPN